MREHFITQPYLGAIPIEVLTCHPRSRDDTEGLCSGLQALWCDIEARDAALHLINECDAKEARCDTGRPGIDFWQVFVFAVAQQGLGIDDDRLGHLASNHRDLRRLAGLSDAFDPAPISAETLINNMSRLDDEV